MTVSMTTYEQWRYPFRRVMSSVERHLIEVNVFSFSYVFTLQFVVQRRFVPPKQRHQMFEAFGHGVVSREAPGM